MSEQQPEPDYASFSSIKLYQGCGKAYFLKKFMNVEEVPAWWFIGGRAVHTTTELYDKWLYEQEGR